MNANILKWTSIYINRALKKHYSRTHIENNYDLFIKVFEKTYDGDSEFEYEEHQDLVFYLVTKFINILYSNRKYDTKFVYNYFLQK